MSKKAKKLIERVDQYIKDLGEKVDDAARSEGVEKLEASNGHH